MKSAIKVIQVLEAAGFEAYMVGGAVRDFLLGKTPHDIDVATSASPLKVKELFRKTVDTGIQHGTVLVLLDGDGIEVTTFRTEGTYTDMRRPDSVEFVQSLSEDLKRRDFTINAMAMTKNKEIIDPFGGKDDLKNRLIRAVGDADRRFSEDALRMLRAVRFSGQLDFAIDPETLAAITRQAPLIRSIAVERIKSEIDKIMANEHTQRSMEYMAVSGLTTHLPAGHLFETDWTGFVPDGNPVSGWAYLLYRQTRQFDQVRGYKFSKEEKQLIEGALKAAQSAEWDPWTFYSYSKEQLNIAAALLGYKLDTEQAKESLPIQSKSDISASGRDLLAWSGDKQGPWLKQWIEKLERQIVYGHLPNDKEIIKEWFMDEYHRHS